MMRSPSFERALPYLADATDTSAAPGPTARLSPLRLADAIAEMKRSGIVEREIAPPHDTIDDDDAAETTVIVSAEENVRLLAHAFAALEEEQAFDGYDRKTPIVGLVVPHAIESLAPADLELPAEPLPLPPRLPSSMRPSVSPAVVQSARAAREVARRARASARRTRILVCAIWAVAVTLAASLAFVAAQPSPPLRLPVPATAPPVGE